MAENWYVILELEFDPPVEDEGKIGERIEEKAKFWSAHFNDFKKGAQYRTWHQNIPQIKKDMLGPANIRKQLAADACTEVYGPVDKYLKTIGRKGNITADEGDKLAQRLKISLDVVKKRALKLGLKWDATPTVDYQAVYDKYIKAKPQGAATYDGMRQMLASFDVEDLYAFLFAKMKIKDPSTLSCAELLQRAAEKKKSEFYKTDSISGTGSKLCGQCEITFKDEAAKSTYDQYLAYMKRKAVLDEVKGIADISGELTADQGDEYIGHLTQLFRDRALAKSVFIAFCKVEKIAYNPSGAAERPKNLKVCRCGCTNDVSDGRKVCSNCGLELIIKCPQCGTENDANIRVCKCGFKFENIDRAITLCELAEYEMETLSFDVARAHLSDAEHYWPKSSKVRDLRSRLAELEKRVGAEVSKMRNAISTKRYFEAQKQYSAIQKLFPGYAEISAEKAIEQALANAEALFKQAQASQTEKEVLELCSNAYELCADYPGIKELMSKYPPASVTGLTVSADSRARGNHISWDGKTDDRSVRYVVVRSDSNWVRSISDGTEVYRGSANTYFDNTVEPGVTYYYNVFVERAGICSKGASGNLDGVTNLFDLGELSLAPSDGSINLMWGALPHNATAEVYQLFPGGMKRHLASSATDGYLVSGLENDKPYQFHVALTYLINAEKKETAGKTVTGIPTCPPAPIDTLRVTVLEDDMFEATWYQKDDGEVRLFCSTAKPVHKAGDIVPIAMLERDMRSLQQRSLPATSAQKLKANERGVTFRYSGSELLYVVAVVVKSGAAVFGSVARAGQGETAKITDIRPANGKINIYLDPPANASGFVVLYRFDQFPLDISDTQTVRKYIPLKQFQLNSAIVLDGLEEKKYFFTVFVEFTLDGEKDYSAGADYIFDNSAKVNITYSISVSKKLFGENSVILEFSVDQGSFQLPDIDIMSCVGNVPMFKKSAKLFHSIPAQEVHGTLQIKLPLPKDTPRDTYIKAFFQDEAAQAGNQLQIKIKSSCKIS